MSKYIGSNFDDFLEEEGVLAEAEAIAVTRARFSTKGTDEGAETQQDPIGQTDEDQPFCVGTVT